MAPLPKATAASPVTTRLGRPNRSRPHPACQRASPRHQWDGHDTPEWSDPPPAKVRDTRLWKRLVTAPFRLSSRTPLSVLVKSFGDWYWVVGYNTSNRHIWSCEYHWLSQPSVLPWEYWQSDYLTTRVTWTRTLMRVQPLRHMWLSTTRQPAVVSGRWATQKMPSCRRLTGVRGCPRPPHDLSTRTRVICEVRLTTW